MTHKARDALEGKPTYHDFGDPVKHLFELVLDILNLT
jgi:hypothetical protein